VSQKLDSFASGSDRFREAVVWLQTNMLFPIDNQYSVIVGQKTHYLLQDE